MQIHNTLLMFVFVTACAVEAEPPGTTTAPEVNVERDVFASSSFDALMKGAYAQLDGDQSLVSLEQAATAAPGHLADLRDEVPAFGALDLARQREVLHACATAYKRPVATSSFASPCTDNCTAGYVIGWSTCTFMAIVDPPSSILCFPAVVKEMNTCMAGCNGGA